MELGLTGKTVVITGGASNIGRAIVLGFASEGCNVVNADIDDKLAQDVIEQAEALKRGGTTIYIKTDVTDPKAVESMVSKALAEFGKIDVLVNNVGWGGLGSFMEKSTAEAEKTMKLNFWAFVNCTRAVLDGMVFRKRGAIVSISSDAGRIGEYYSSLYSGAKGAIIATSKSIARETGRYGIRVNVVAPGTVPPSSNSMGQYSMWRDGLAGMNEEALEKASKLYALRRLGRPEEVANAVVFLASDAASFITGQTLSVSGGYTML